MGGLTSNFPWHLHCLLSLRQWIILHGLLQAHTSWHLRCDAAVEPTVYPAMYFFWNPPSLWCCFPEQTHLKAFTQIAHHDLAPNCDSLVRPLGVSRGYSPVETGSKQKNSDTLSKFQQFIVSCNSSTIGEVE